MIKLYTILRIENRGIWPGGEMVQGREVMIFGIRHGRQKSKNNGIGITHLGQSLMAFSTPIFAKLQFRLSANSIGSPIPAGKQKGQ
jgi:hypothetical protein